MKKLMAMMVVTVIMMGIFTGCGNTNPIAPVDETKLILTYMGQKYVIEENSSFVYGNISNCGTINGIISQDGTFNIPIANIVNGGNPVDLSNKTIKINFGYNDTVNVSVNPIGLNVGITADNSKDGNYIGLDPIKDTDCNGNTSRICPIYDYLGELYQWSSTSSFSIFCTLDGITPWVSKIKSIEIY